MPRKACCWTRKMEIQLVEFMHLKQCIWRPNGNTNFHIKQKYRAYAEFAAKLGKGFTARSVRDRWVNIRSTFNHYARRVEKSKAMANSPSEIYVPCWPLWKPMQFLRESFTNDTNHEGINLSTQEPSSSEAKDIINEYDDIFNEIRQKPRKPESHCAPDDKECFKVIDRLLTAIKPIVERSTTHKNETYWYFGRHVTERLYNMLGVDAESASQEILKLIENCTYAEELT